MAGQRFVAIDGMRGLAAIVVMFTHAGPLYDRMVPHGHVAVDLFFMLSGFILAEVYSRRFDAGLSLVGYMKNRLMRLYPMLVAGTLLATLLLVAGLSQYSRLPAEEIGTLVLAQLLLVPGLGASGYFFGLNVPQWSIMFELLANAIHRLIHSYLTAPVMGLIIIISGTIMIEQGLAAGTMDFGYKVGEFRAGLARGCFGFFVGIAISRSRIAARTRGRPRVKLLAWLILLIVAVGPHARGVTGLDNAVYEVAVVVIVLPLLTLASAIAPGSATDRGIGTLSYPLYALHAPVLGAFLYSGATSGTMLLVAVAMIFASYFVGRDVDEPFMAWRGERMRRQRRNKETPRPA